MSLRKRARELNERQVADLLRGRILSGIHSGHMAPGDRLPTYREVSDETGLDLRAVTRVYQVLQRDGLVEVRGRAGVFVAPQGRVGGRVLAETARWFVGVLREAWIRRIRLPDFPEFARQCISGVEVRCACLESTEDQLQTICTELHRDFGIRSHPVRIDRLGSFQNTNGLPENVPAELRDADFLVTTAFHSAVGSDIARILEKPLVVIRLNPDFVRDIERRLDAGALTVLCVDPRYLERMRLVFGGEHAGRIRGVLASDAEAVQRLPVDVPVHVTNAALERLAGTPLPPVLFPQDRRAMSRESADDLAEILVRINIEAMDHPSRPSHNGTERG